MNFDPDTYTVDEGDSEVLILMLNSPADRSVSVDVTLNPDTATGEMMLRCCLTISSFFLHEYFGALSAVLKVKED